MSQESDSNQNIVHASRVLFVGAGASAPLGLHTTRAFLPYLQEKLVDLAMEGERKSPSNKAEWINQCGQFFSQAARHFGVNMADSEYVLDYLAYLEQACRELAEAPIAFRAFAGTEGVAAYHSQWEQMLLRIRRYIEQVVVEHYSTVDGSKALAIYDDCLRALHSGQSLVPIFTTNYDWVFEHFVESAEERWELIDGFDRTALGERWNSRAFLRWRPDVNKQNLVLFKLHGSTSWYRDYSSPQVIRKVPTAGTAVGKLRPVLVYPTQVKSGLVEVEPFQTGYSYLRACLRHAALCVVVGFSFRDPAINTEFKEALAGNQQLKLLIVEPSMNNSGGVSFNQLLELLGVSESIWKDRIKVVKARFGGDKYAAEQVCQIVRQFDDWNSVAPWLEPTSASSGTVAPPEPEPKVIK